MPRREYGEQDNTRFVHSDNVVGVMGEFPELTKAVRERDLATITALCAQLFDLNSAAQLRPFPTSIAS